MEKEKESKEYWPEISSPADLVKYTGTDITLYALEDAVYARSKTGNLKRYPVFFVPGIIGNCET